VEDAQYDVSVILLRKMRKDPVASKPTAGVPPAEAEEPRAEEFIPQFTIECVWVEPRADDN
jgi:hypothetical protein